MSSTCTCVASLVMVGLLGASPAPSLTPTPLQTSPSLAAIHVIAPKATLRLEVARTESERETGLMYRTKLPAHTGMLFVFAQDAQVDFWMKDTLIPLDMIFIASDGRVRSIATNVPATTPQTPDAKIPRRGGRAEYVIELPASEAARDGITVNTNLAIQLPPANNGP